ncbi:hypothetical protein FSP39_004891 [Pinctada imbricata]|uniref:Phosphatidylinositol-specific phospholipase C X domain-containing protein n=1 Tax=Pinctada imbricata TaxID=66713 RepID=A0AA88YPX1_PINIB|nr:hypothetical protein FSP39_004891 [Pinctada imbricata]
MLDRETLQTSSWMGDLPTSLTKVPLSCLAIPGSHDSGTFCLHPEEGVAVDQSDAIRRIVTCCCGLGKSVIHKWSQTQTLDFIGQLDKGVRYLDLRVCGKPESADLYFVHGLYGQRVSDGLRDIERFLHLHPQEIILLDFNHFYNMTPDDHTILLNEIKDIFGAKLAEYNPYLSLWKLTLEHFWRTPQRLIIFYHNPMWNSVNFTWPSELIPSPWANVSSTSSLVQFHEHNYFGHTRSDNGAFYVWQGVLTPSTATVAGHLFSSVKDRLAHKATRAFLSWLGDKVPSHIGINICISDFVEDEDFTTEVILLNNKVQYREIRL